mgnify:CR=1 FL=1
MPTRPNSCRAGSHTHHAPGGELSVRVIDGGSTLTYTGQMGRNDVAVLSRCLHTQLDANPRVLVLDLSQAEPTTPELLDILRRVRRRARSQDVGVHLLDRSDLRLGGALGLHQRRCELPDRYNDIRHRINATTYPTHHTQHARRTRHTRPIQRHRAVPKIQLQHHPDRRAHTASP